VVQCIKEIRKALGTDARWMIRTVPGAGYEFTAPIKELRPAEEEASPPRSEGVGECEAPEIGLAGRIRGIARRPVFIGSIALTAGVVLTIAVAFLWSANSPRNALLESYRYKPIGDILTGEQVTIRTSDGKEMTCIGGQVGRLPRQCWWN
jgi:hypothetical protein